MSVKIHMSEAEFLALTSLLEAGVQSLNARLTEAMENARAERAAEQEESNDDG